jgi:GntR family transcriptional regulator/MocR family aminotransferase
MYLVAWLNHGIDDQATARAAAARSVDVIPLSTFCIRPLRRKGLVLGYSAYEENRIRLAVKQLCAALSRMRPSINRSRSSVPDKFQSGDETVGFHR